MPPWPSRLHLASPAASNTTSSGKGRGAKSPPNSSHQFDSHLQDLPLLGVPVLASTDSIAPSPSKQKPRHGRSHSNPFTSIFGNGKKTEKVDDVEREDDTTDQRAISSHGVLNKDHMVGPNGTPTKPGEKELMVGKCGTCDAAMKWPRQVDSYRCQICLMINDLKLSNGPLGQDFTAEASGSAAWKKCKSTYEKLERFPDFQIRSDFVTRKDSKSHR